MSHDAWEFEDFWSMKEWIAPVGVALVLVGLAAFFFLAFHIDAQTKWVDDLNRPGYQVGYTFSGHVIWRKK